MTTPAPDPRVAPESASTGSVPPGVSGPPGWLLTVINDQRVAFLAVGAVNTAIGFGWFVVFQYLVGRHHGYLYGLALAHVASVFCAFWLYRHLVFRVRGHLLRDLLRFETVYLGALAVNFALLPFFVEIVNLPVLLGQVMVVFVTSVMSWVGHKNFSFRRRHHAGPVSAGRPPTGPDQK